MELLFCLVLFVFVSILDIVFLATPWSYRVSELSVFIYESPVDTVPRCMEYKSSYSAGVSSGLYSSEQI